MSNTFSYVRYDQESVTKQETLKGMFEAIEAYCRSNLYPGRASSLVYTKLEEAYMWTGKAIRDQQIIRNSQTEHVAERTNE